MRLLIVDDSKIIRNRIQRAVADHGLEIVGIAKDGREAVQLVQHAKPEVVTMDLTMPEMDGIECITNIMKMDRSVLVLVVSALADKATAIDAMKRGARGFLCKPFTEKELTDAIAELIRGARKK